MKTKLKLPFRCLRLALGLAMLPTLNSQLSASAQSTAFTYQGRLNDGGSPASGIYDLRFTIYDAATGGNIIGGPLTSSTTPITSGLFTVTLDFGPGIFSGADRWLDVGVRTNGASVAYSTLAPRQKVTASPYALMANAATTLVGTLALTNGGTGQSSYAPGDLLYAATSSSLARLAVGAPGRTLAVSGGLPAWMNANAHDHFGQRWSGDAHGSDGLSVHNTSTGNGFPTGLSGESVAQYGSGVYGLASAPSGPPTGIFGEAYSTNGIGVYGLGSATSGVPVGVYGAVDSPLGYGLYTQNRLFVGDLAFFEGHIALISPARLFVDAGSASLPGLTFMSSSDVGLFSPATNVLGVATAGAERLRIDGAGNVGIGRVPATNMLEVAGEASKATAGNWFANSDARIKTDVRTLTNALQTIERLRPVSFRYNEAYRQAHPGIEDRLYFNVIAQEFAKVFPDSVKESGEKVDGQPIMQVDTYPATIVCIAAIKELHDLMQARDEALEQFKRAQADLQEMKRRQAALEKRLRALETDAGRAPKFSDPE